MIEGQIKSPTERLIEGQTERLLGEYVQLLKDTKIWNRWMDDRETDRGTDRQTG